MTTETHENKSVLLGLRITPSTHRNLLEVASQECAKPKAVSAVRKLISEGIMRRKLAPKPNALVRKGGTYRG